MNKLYKHYCTLFHQAALVSTCYVQGDMQKYTIQNMAVESRGARGAADRPVQPCATSFQKCQILAKEVKVD